MNRPRPQFRLLGIRRSSRRGGSSARVKRISLTCCPTATDLSGSWVRWETQEGLLGTLAAPSAPAHSSPESCCLEFLVLGGLTKFKQFLVLQVAKWPQRKSSPFQVTKLVKCYNQEHLSLCRQFYLRINSGLRTLNAFLQQSGMSVALLGPTFQDLARNVNQNISSLSLIFVGRASGYLCGSMIGGILFDCMNHFIVLGVTLLATTAGLYLIPFCKTPVLLIVMMSVFGVALGALDTGGNVLILAVWGDKGAPHMQALHFSFALGAFLAPLLAKLALGTTVSTENHTEPDLHPPALNQSPEAGPDPLFAVPDDLNLLWAYASVGAYIFVVSIFLFALFFKKTSKHGKSTASAQVSRRAKYHKALLCLLFMFFFFYVGAEVTYGSYVFSFATTHVGMEESEAAGLNSIFWGTFAACRGLAIFFATCLQPGTMIMLSNIGSLVSSLFLVLFDKNPLCLWIATSVYGASMATTFPSGVSWIEQYISIHGKVASLFVVGAALGEMAIPAVIGILQGQHPDLPVVLYTCLGSAIFTAVLFPVMYKLAILPLDLQRKENRRSEDHKALLNDCEDSEGEDAEKWNEMDFEIVDMNVTVRPSVIHTSRNILIDPRSDEPNCLHSTAVMFER